MYATVKVTVTKILLVSQLLFPIKICNNYLCWGRRTYVCMHACCLSVFYQRWWEGNGGILKQIQCYCLIKFTLNAGKNVPLKCSIVKNVLQ